MPCVVYKYGLEIVGLQFVWVPRGARLLHVAGQHGVPTLWAEVDRSETLCKRAIFIRTTGGEVSATVGQQQYLGTVLLRHGELALHVFDGGVLPDESVDSGAEFKP